MSWTTENKEECWVCQSLPNPNYMSKRCDDHDTCLKCGTHRKHLEDIPWGTKGGFVCKPCENKRLQNQIEEWQSEERDTEDTDDLICPNCGTKHTSDGESREFYEEGTHDYECGECYYTFEMQTTVSITYSTFRKK